LKVFNGDNWNIAKIDGNIDSVEYHFYAKMCKTLSITFFSESNIFTITEEEILKIYVDSIQEYKGVSINKGIDLEYVIEQYSCVIPTCSMTTMIDGIKSPREIEFLDTPETIIHNVFN